MLLKLINVYGKLIEMLVKLINVYDEEKKKWYYIKLFRDDRGVLSLSQDDMQY